MLLSTAGMKFSGGLVFVAGTIDFYLRAFDVATSKDSGKHCCLPADTRPP